MKQNIFIQEYQQIIFYFYQLLYAWNILVAILEFVRGNLMEYQKLLSKK